MTDGLTDEQIAALIAEPKVIEPGWRLRLRGRAGKLGHSVRDVDVRGEHGGDFRVIVRQSLFQPLDFSVILGYLPRSGPRLFRLRRYNGLSHEHRNRIEGDVFYDFHIHHATERYQALGMWEDSYAEVTDRYADLAGAADALIMDCGFQTIRDTQLSWLDRIQ